jgi:uncharacterized protein
MSDTRKFQLHDGKSGSAITVRITPRARHNEIVEILNDGTIKIRLTAPPVEGQANQELIDFLSDILDVSKSRIEIVAGLTGKDKLVTIDSMTTEAVQKKIVQALAKTQEE